MAVVVAHDGSQAGAEVGELLLAALGEAAGCAVVELPENPSELKQLLSPRAVLLVSSEPDGTVTRSVRKLLRGLRADAPQLDGLHCLCLLLGGARCRSSAVSTKDEVYRSGRKLGHAMGLQGARVAKPPSPGFFELDVELEDIQLAVSRWATAATALPATTTPTALGAAPHAPSIATALEAEPEPEPEPELQVGEEAVGSPLLVTKRGS